MGRNLTMTTRAKEADTRLASYGTLDPAGPLVDVHLFESPDLPEHWYRLDEFEGAEYRRVVTQVRTGEGDVPAWIYVLARGDRPR